MSHPIDLRILEIISTLFSADWLVLKHKKNIYRNNKLLALLNFFINFAFDF